MRKVLMNCPAKIGPYNRSCAYIKLFYLIGGAVVDMFKMDEYKVPAIIPATNEKGIILTFLFFLNCAPSRAARQK